MSAHNQVRASCVRRTCRTLHECNKSAILLDLCVSSLRRGHANLLCIVPIFTDDHRSGSYLLGKPLAYKYPTRPHIQPEPLPPSEAYTFRHSSITIENVLFLSNTDPRSSCMEPSAEGWCMGRRNEKATAVRFELTRVAPLT